MLSEPYGCTSPEVARNRERTRTLVRKSWKTMEKLRSMWQSTGSWVCKFSANENSNSDCKAHVLLTTSRRHQFHRTKINKRFLGRNTTKSQMSSTHTIDLTLTEHSSTESRARDYECPEMDSELSKLFSLFPSSIQGTQVGCEFLIKEMKCSQLPPPTRYARRQRAFSSKISIKSEVSCIAG